MTIDARLLEYDSKRRVFTGKASQFQNDGSLAYTVQGRYKTVQFVPDEEDMRQNEYYDGEMSTLVSVDVTPEVRMVLWNY